MKIKNAMFLLAFALVIGMTSAAQAVTVPLGPITFHWTNWENRVTGTGEGLAGIFRLDQILDVNNNAIWQDGDGGERLTGEFHDLTVDVFEGESTGDQILFTGGVLNVFRGTGASFGFDPTNATTATDGSLYLSSSFVTGRNLGDATHTLSSIVTGTGVDPEGFASIRGTGNALLEVTGGEAAGLFDSNTFARLDGSGQFADMTLDANFFIRNTGTAPINNPKDGWDVWSKDPIGANAIPEPTSMFLFGMGLAGLASALRKKAA